MKMATAPTLAPGYFGCFGAGGAGGGTFEWLCWIRLLRSAEYAVLVGFFTMLRWSFGV